MDGETKMEWKTGDVLGCWCKYAASADDDNKCMSYALNGADLGTAFTMPTSSGNDFGYYPAVSLNLNEVLDVNVGPQFAFDAKDGCVGACELLGKVEEGDDAESSGENDVSNGGDSSKPKDAAEATATAEDVTAPARKRPRGEQQTTDETINKQENNVDSTSGEKELVFDLNNCSSVDELNEMNPERLKKILLSMGVKCGGTPEERAKRLFSLKEL
mmetsp:Transcript_16390/g.28034  ORF Transcript_16390/g.28034 Transcript_16390/m.28034 type:complete len:216 (-) Transcript_16390:155-802(-)